MRHAAEVKQLKGEADELRSSLSQMEKELMNVKTELEIQKEANNRAPTTTMKNLVERLKNQLSLKEKQQKVSHLYRKSNSGVHWLMLPGKYKLIHAF